MEIEKKKWYEEYMDLETIENIIQANLASAARNFVTIGFYLRKAKEEQSYLEKGFSSVWEFAEKQFGISRSTASRYIAVNERFSEDGNSPKIAEKYKAYGKNQMIEMLTLPDGEIQNLSSDMTIREIRALKPKKETEEKQLDGQMQLSDYPEVIPLCETIRREEKNELSVESNKESVPCSFSPLCDVAQEQVIEEIHQNEWKREEKKELQESNEIEFYDKEILEAMIQDAEKTFSIMKEYWKEHQPKNYTEYVMKIQAYKELLKKREQLEENAEQEEIKIEQLEENTEQPGLPLFKNQEQRATFIDNYETWKLWIETKETGERYYRYDLSDGSSMIVKVYHAMLFDYASSGRYADGFKEGYGRQEYYLLEPGKFFRNCETNRSMLIEKLKQIQKDRKKGDGV